MARYEREQRRLGILLDTDPAGAVREARALEPDPANLHDWNSLRAAIMIDGGVSASDPNAVAEGVALLREIMSAAGDAAGDRYNLANGLGALSNMTAGDPVDRAASTLPLRQEARQHLWAVGHDPEADAVLRACALTNLGNSLGDAGRWIEALDSYSAALAVDPEHGFAAGRTAQILLSCRSGEDDEDDRALDHFAGGYARIAQEAAEQVLALAGPSAVERFAELSTSDYDPVEYIYSECDEYARFVASERLVVSPFVESRAGDPANWDRLHIETLSEDLSTGPQTPPLVAMLNVMKAQFLVARKLLFEGARAIDSWEASDRHLYMDTLDYAVYGEAATSAVAAQTLALDVLDKIAGAVNEWLGLGLDPRHTWFRSMFVERAQGHRPEAPRYRWSPRVEPEIRAGNRGLLALAELAGR